MSIFNGIDTTWSYNSTDDIAKPLSIQFLQFEGAHTSIKTVGDNLNITRGAYKIKTAVFVAESYGLNFFFDNEIFGVNDLRASFSSDPGGTLSIISATAVTKYTSTISTVQIASHTIDQTSGLPTGSAQAQEATSETKRGGLSRGGKIGTGIGISIGTAVIVGFLILLHRLHRRGIIREPQQDSVPVSIPTEVGGTDLRPELDGKPVRPVSELPS